MKYKETFIPAEIVNGPEVIGNIKIMHKFLCLSCKESETTAQCYQLTLILDVTLLSTFYIFCAIYNLSKFIVKFIST